MDVIEWIRWPHTSKLEVVWVCGVRDDAMGHSPAILAVNILQSLVKSWHKKQAECKPLGDTIVLDTCVGRELVHSDRMGSASDKVKDPVVILCSRALSFLASFVWIRVLNAELKSIKSILTFVFDFQCEFWCRWLQRMRPQWNGLPGKQTEVGCWPWCVTCLASQNTSWLWGWVLLFY